MKGLELCRLYYEEVGAPALKAAFPELMGRAAAGLAGQGSDCLGFDDEYSRDHDFGPGFLVWLTDADFEEYGAALQAAYEALPREYRGFTRRPTHTGAQRVGVMRTSDFYNYYIGCAVPDTLMKWVRIQEHFLATCTSGEVFEDGLGEFTAIRSALLPCYPEDVRLKKLAARAATTAQSFPSRLWKSVRPSPVTTQSAPARWRSNCARSSSSPAPDSMRPPRCRSRKPTPPAAPSPGVSPGSFQSSAQCSSPRSSCSTSAESAQAVTPESPLMNDPYLAPSERELLGFILNNGEDTLNFDIDSDLHTEEPMTVAEFIDGSLAADNEEFCNEVYRKTYEAYFTLYEEGLNQEQITRRLMDSQEREIADIAVDLIIPKYDLSVKNYIDSMTSTQTQLVMYVPRSVIIYKIKRIEKRIREYSEQLASLAVEEQDEAAEIMNRIKKMYEAKNILDERIGRRFIRK